MKKRFSTKENLKGFTIVELLIVIVIIAILAAISIVVYNGIQSRAVDTALKTDLRNASTKIDLAKAETGSYPTDEEEGLALMPASPGTDYQYTSDGSSYYITIRSDKPGAPAYCKVNNSPITEGPCPGHYDVGEVPIINIQTITNANCPTDRTVVVDARDNRTYWIQKLGDNKCRMLTNLAYAGGGDNTYGDVKPLTNGESLSKSFTSPYFYVPPGANPTTSPAEPSTSTTGTGQYGYLYNWCAAMGGQATAACALATTPAPNPAISICPAGWRLPIGNTSGEFSPLNAAVNGGATNTDAGLRNNWLAQYSGQWYEGFGGFNSQGSGGYYWSSTQYLAASARDDYFQGNSVGFHYNSEKSAGHAVRCIAN